MENENTEGLKASVERLKQLLKRRLISSKAKALSIEAFNVGLDKTAENLLAIAGSCLLEHEEDELNKLTTKFVEERNKVMESEYIKGRHIGEAKPEN